MGITFLQGRICNTVVVHYGVSHSTLVTTSSRTVCTQQLRRVWFSSSQHQTHHRVQKQTQNSEHVSQTSALDGQHTKSTQKKHTSLKYSLNSLQIWQRNHRRQRVSEAHLMFWNVFHWMEEVQSGFLWLCFSETCTAQLATVDSLKAFPLA